MGFWELSFHSANRIENDFMLIGMIFHKTHLTLYKALKVGQKSNQNNIRMLEQR